MQHSGPVPLYCFGSFFHLLNPVMGGLEIPILEGFLEPFPIFFFVDFLDVLSNMISLHCFQVKLRHEFNRMQCL
jgi:hypothetical protein